MFQKPWSLALIAVAAMGISLTVSNSAIAKSSATSSVVSEQGNALLWLEPKDITSRNLYYGPGGEKDQPHAPFTFIDEDLDGTNPKYVVRDRDNVKWTVKLGMEARPETVASRLVWSVGYFTNEDYFLQDIQVSGMPSRLKRGRKLVGVDGTMHAVRLKRHMEDEKTIGNWKWSDDPFAGSRELNGLKVMMALINNWDLKDANNKIYGGKKSEPRIYAVSDLGASFGTTGLSFPFSHSKGDLNSYMHSKFISKITPEYVDFQTPTRPSFVYLSRPVSFIQRTHLDGMLRNVPRDDARWTGQILAQLSADQIHQAFLAAGYTPDQVEAFSKVIQDRIAQLNNL
jgi:hypothetical protein